MMSSFASGVGLALLTGCTSVPPAKQYSFSPTVLQSVMERKNKIVKLSSETDRDKPVLLLLHGATDDPKEMLDIAQDWVGTYNVFLYSYNYHQRIKGIGADFVTEIKRLQSENPLMADATVLVYSYSAIVFRQAVIAADDPCLFSRMSLVQLVPTAGGSYTARWVHMPVLGPMMALASKPCAATNPYGAASKRLWGEEGNKKFCEMIPPERTVTILVEEDSHSLTRSKNEKLLQRYRNGVGVNIVVIPKSMGVIHDYCPGNPVTLEYLRRTLEPSAAGNEGIANEIEERTPTPTLSHRMGEGER